VIHVVNAVINRRGESAMTTEEQESTQATATAKESEAPKTARVAPRRAHVASSKAKSGKKPTLAKKSTKAPKKARVAKTDGVREGSKTAKVLDLLKRPGGATTKELIKATGWQTHSVRGFLSGTIGKKMALAVTSTKGEDGERSYSVKG
jgi:uncharacterized protein DUF3489